MKPFTLPSAPVGANFVSGRSRMLNLVIAGGSLAAIGWSLTLAQGPLTPPPGAPAPTMKALWQIEPRSEVNSTNTPGDADSLYRISQPGSYYLTSSLLGVSGKHGIEIAANAVTLDLGGFVLTGVTGSLSGIFVSTPLEHLTVRNGSVRAWIQYGIDARDCSSGHFEDLRVSGNHSNGLSAGNDAIVTRCSARSNTSRGIDLGAACTATACSVFSNGFFGLLGGEGTILSLCTADSNTNIGLVVGDNSSVSDCLAQNGTSTGIATGNFSSITNCAAGNNASVGILAGNPFSFSVTGNGCSVTNCTASSNQDDGIQAAPGTTLDNCASDLNKRDGFHVFSGCAIRHCSARSNGRNGINCDEQSQVLENNCAENGTNPGGGAGIYVGSGQGSRVDGNAVVGNTRGIEVVTDRNLIVRNSCRTNNGHNYVIAAANRLAQIIIPAANAAAVDGDSAGPGFTSTDPWANFSY
jgi:parallel beta-helix repeat protein